MKFIKLLGVLLLTASINSGIIAQQKQGHSRIPISRSVGKGKVVDQTKVRVWYALNADKIDDMNTYVDFQRLDIGDSITKCYSWFVFNSDSLRADWSKKNRNAKSAPMWLGPGGKKQNNWCQYEWSDFYIRNGELTEYACMPDKLGSYNSFYSEPYPQMSWTLGMEHQTVIGYDCQKATCHWRGRDYEAWFATDIPVKTGPWKFGGLPGLILKVYDTYCLYTFEAVAIEKGKYPIVQYEYKGYKKSTRAEVQKCQRTFTENWPKAVGWRSGTVDAGGHVILGEAVSIHTPYEPLELTEEERSSTGIKHEK